MSWEDDLDFSRMEPDCDLISQLTDKEYGFDEYGDPVDDYDDVDEALDEWEQPETD